MQVIMDIAQARDGISFLNLAMGTAVLVRLDGGTVFHVKKYQ